jgi:hypothetical protein
MNTRFAIFGLTSVAALAGVFACTTTTRTIENDPGTDGGKDSSTTSKEGGTSSTTDKDSGTTTTDPDEACAEEGTLQACGQCCIKEHTKGYKVFEAALVACACEGTGSTADGGAPACADECADTLCASTPAQPDATCQTCLEGSIGQGEACTDAVSTACSDEPDCLAQQECVAGCPKK